MKIELLILCYLMQHIWKSMGSISIEFLTKRTFSCKGLFCWRSLKGSFFCFMFNFACWTLFISRINRARLYIGLVDSHRQPNSDLAQLAVHGTDDLEVVGSIPTGDNFFYFALLLRYWQDWQERLHFAKTRLKRIMNSNNSLYNIFQVDAPVQIY